MIGQSTKKEKRFPCEFCDSKFTEKNNLKRHSKKHFQAEEPASKKMAILAEPFSCSHCHANFAKTEILRTHVLDCVSKNHVCKFCENRFSSKQDLTKHIETEHVVRIPIMRKEKPIEKNSVSKNVLSQDFVQRVNSGHEGSSSSSEIDTGSNRNLDLQDVNLQDTSNFNDQDVVNQHQFDNNDQDGSENSSQSNINDQVDLSELEVNVETYDTGKTTHGSNDVLVAEPIVTMDSDQCISHGGLIVYRCPFPNCTEISSNVKTHRRHLRDHTRCDYCNFSSENPDTLDRHKRVLHNIYKRRVLPNKTSEDQKIRKPLSCKYCAFATANEATHLQHMVKVHSYSRNNFCSICGVGLKDRQAWRDHNKDYHCVERLLVTKKLEFFCREIFCSSSFSTQGMLNKHLKDVHFPKQKFKPECSNANSSPNRAKLDCKIKNDGQDLRLYPNGGVILTFKYLNQWKDLCTFEATKDIAREAFQNLGVLLDSKLYLISKEVNLAIAKNDNEKLEDMQVLFYAFINDVGKSHINLSDVQQIKNELLKLDLSKTYPMMIKVKGEDEQKLPTLYYMSFEKNLNLSSFVPIQMRQIDDAKSSKIDIVKKSADLSKIKNTNKNSGTVIQFNNPNDIIEKIANVVDEKFNNPKKIRKTSKKSKVYKKNIDKMINHKSVVQNENSGVQNFQIQ